MLQIQNIYKQFNNKPILTDVNVEVPNGVTHALVGSSGAGKTTLLRVTLGLIPFEKGYVKIDNQALLSFKPSQWSEKVGYVPQDGGLFPHLSARRNVTLMARLRGWDKNKIRKRLEELCSIVDLSINVLERFPHELSGGQNQRVAIMRAAFMNPSVMIFDEPLGSLDPILRRSLQNELKTIFRKLQKTVLIVTHDLAEAVFFAEKLTLLHQGRVIQTGTYQDLVLHPTDPFVTSFVQAYRGLPDIQGQS